MVIDIQQTDAFANWLHVLKDQQAKTKIASRIRRMALGHAGDIAPVGDGVSEMRIHSGPGYRVYFIQKVTGRIVILLCGGDKSSQSRDIAKAKEMAARLDEDGI